MGTRTRKLLFPSLAWKISPGKPTRYSELLQDALALLARFFQEEGRAEEICQARPNVVERAALAVAEFSLNHECTGKSLLSSSEGVKRRTLIETPAIM